ncbi:MAG: polysaccharide lyase family 8 super-sandwich domain-containing protein [candidate division KSB1 bacterium]|nr:polysaccharide lyase family 8 super-sandwich domain-containing protein [candidate division KSB1 bacterium]
MRIWILIVIVILLGGAVGAQADDLQVLKSRILDPLQNARVDTDQVQRLITAQQPEGSWPSIDYSDSTRSGWKLNQHLYNLTKLTLAYRSDRSPLQGQPELRRAVHAALNDWLQHDYQNPNWWHNVIGVPRSLSSLFLLLQSELDSVQLSKGIEILKRAELGMTGQNLVWVAGVTINRGILQNDLALVDSAFARIESEIRITTAEGIQPDFSFHQHGNCLYNHGYGSGFAVDVSRLAALAAGTRFEFSAEKINILTRYILDGSAWMIYGRTADYGALGREITRPGENAGYLRNAAENLLQLDTGREEELQRLINRITYPDTANIFGNKHFWRSDFMTHHRPDYYASVRMYSTRMDNTDNPYNSEGLKSHHIADGCNFRFVSGNEYKNIFPLWDWRRIPGTTVIQFDSLQGNVRRSGRSDFVGGVSDGTYGLAAFDFKYDSLAARKSWFFFDRQYVCLGAGISSNTNEPVYTTVDQCYLNGEVSISKESVQTPSRGEHRIKGPVMIRHASAEYIFPSIAN